MNAENHPPPEVLTAFADDEEHSDLTPLMVRHIHSCDVCQNEITLLQRGLSTLAAASPPPQELERSARARHWAWDGSAADWLAEDEDLPEVVGRGLEEAENPPSDDRSTAKRKGPEEGGEDEP